MLKSKDYSQFMDALKADYTRLERPSFASSYRHAQRVASFVSFQEWDVPSRERAKLLLDKDMPQDANEQSGIGFFNIEAAKESCAENVVISNWEELPNGYIVITTPRFLYDLANRDEISFAQFIHGVIGQRRDEAMRSDLRLGRSKRQLQPVDPVANKFRFFLWPLRFCKSFLKYGIVQRFLSNVRRLTGGRKNV